VLAERVKRGIDPKPPRREIAGDLEQRLELIERLLGLAHQDIDPPQLVLDVGPVDRTPTV
jgi:hypothetical protein